MGPIDRARKLANRLSTMAPIDNARDEQTYSRLVHSALAGLNAAWSNDAVTLDAARTKNDLLDVWHDLIHPVTDEDIARHDAIVQEHRDNMSNR